MLCACQQHVDPCAGYAGACVGVHLDSEVRPIDQIAVILDGAASQTTPAVPATLQFPVRFAVHLTAGQHRLGFAGLYKSAEQAAALADVNPAPHSEISVTLRQSAAVDLSLPGDLSGADLAGADFAGAAVDLAGADLALPSYTLTVKKGGSGDGSISVGNMTCTPPCALPEPAGGVVAIVATPDPDSMLVALTGACISTSGGCMVTMNGPSAVTVNFKSLSKTMVSILPVPISANLSNVVIAPTPAPASSCGSNCYLYPNGLAITLNAQVTGGGTFLGWGGVAGCNFKPSCNIALAGDVGITASYSDAPINYAFMTSTTYTPMDLNSLGNPLYTADQACQGLALAAGVPDHTSFKAWLSTGPSPAPMRLGGALGWVRTDGLPFANSLATGGLPLYPLALDQSGIYSGKSAWTATNSDGTVAADCAAWTNYTNLSGAFGSNTEGSAGWTQYGLIACSNSLSLYCLGTARNRPLDFTAPIGARRAFVSAATVNGTADFDTLCQMEADAQSLGGTWRSYRHDAGASGLLLFDQTAGPWVRLDNVLLSPIAATSTIEADTPQRLAPLGMKADGATLAYFDHAWVGSATNNCQGWSTTSMQAEYLLATRVRGSASMTASCQLTKHFYCLEE